MYPTSDAYKAAIFAHERTTLSRIDDVDGNVLIAPEAMKSADIEAAANSGDDITLGSCLCDQIKITAMDEDGTLTTIDWDGREIVPYMGVETTGGPELVPMGVFVVTKAEGKNNFLVEIEAQDRMCKTETTWTTENETWPMTLAQLVARACEVSGIELGNTDWPNADMPIELGAAVETSAKAIISYAAQAAGCFARMGRDGKLYLRWYSDSGRTITAASAYTHTVAKYTVPAIDQVRVMAEEGDLGIMYPETQEATNSYQIIGNPLLYALSAAPKDQQQAALKAIYDQVSTLPYTPQEVEAQGDPSLEPGDMVTITNKHGEAVVMPIMAYKITHNGGMRMTISSQGTSPSEPRQQGPITEQIIALRQKSNVLERDLEQNRLEIKEVTHDVGSIVTEINEITQRVDGLVLSASRTGGANLVHGSSARLGLDDWEVEGAVVCDTSTPVHNATAAGGCFALGQDGTLGQTLDVVAGKRYAWYYQYRLAAGLETVATAVIGGQVQELIDTGGEWAEMVGSFIPAESSARIEFAVVAGALDIADITVIQGDNCSAWQQAQNEIEAGGVTVTSRGVQVTKEGDPFEARLDNQQVRFTNRDTGDDVAYFNKDQALIRSLSAESTFTVRRPGDDSKALRIIPVDTGAFFVVND